MSQPAILQLNTLTTAPQTYHLPPDKLIAGNPLQTLWPHYTDASGRFSSGIWHSEVGTWRVRYTEEEYCEILEGRSIVTDEQGHAVTVKTGDRFVIPSGFVGTWEVVEPTRKVYVMDEAVA
jgi:uncharacterized cupin superfamily protein